MPPASQASDRLSGDRDVAQLGSALDWGSRGRRFKSCRPDQYRRRSEAVFHSRGRRLLTHLPDRGGHLNRRNTSRPIDILMTVGHPRSHEHAAIVPRPTPAAPPGDDRRGRSTSPPRSWSSRASSGSRSARSPAAWASARPRSTSTSRRSTRCTTLCSPAARRRSWTTSGPTSTRTTTTGPSTSCCCTSPRRSSSWSIEHPAYTPAAVLATRSPASRRRRRHTHPPSS